MFILFVVVTYYVCVSCIIDFVLSYWVGFMLYLFFFSVRRRHTSCALVTEVQTCALPIIIAIGSDAMMAAVGRARHEVLKPFLKPRHHAVASINSPMQCMMKEICAQCLQPHRDPLTGKESVVFSCFNQDQEMDRVDFAALRSRLSQNGEIGRAHV